MKLLHHQSLYVALFLGAALAIATGAEAGGHDSRRGPPAGPDVERLAAELELSEEQAAAVEEIFEDAAERRQSLRAEQGGGRSAAGREEAMAIREETQARLAEVLTETQLEKLAALRAERGPRHGGRFRDR